ncbi:MAG TPA: hypothetical protein VMW15_04220 [Terracidiphilus sp.]|nr:hypothetical protein [Terracidiphilus sp.]
MQTPWGPSQECKSCGDGLVFVSTASHGGFYVPPEMLAQMPEYFRRNNGWYEEDCEWAMVVISFPSRFSEKETVDASGTLQNWFPDLYERHFAVRLLPGESYKRDQALFDEENKDKLVATCAWGDWHKQVPADMVGVFATKGGSRNPERDNSTDRYFLVPAAEYEARAHFGFVVDPSRHTECAPLA